MVDRQGRILIPAAARAWCGIEPGDTLLVFMDGDEDTLLLRKGETPPAPDAPEENRQTVAEEVDTGQAPTQSGPWIYFF